MRFDMRPEDKAFLRLAEKVAAGKGSRNDRDELKIIMKENPELGEEFDKLRRNLDDEMAAEFWSVAVRVMVGTASPEEVNQIESLKTTDPHQWEEYQDALDFVNAMASLRESPKSPKIEPMPPHVRKELLRQLRLEKTSKSGQSGRK